MILVMLTQIAWAASDATIKGKVVDASTGKSVDYADVIVTNLQDKVIASGMVNNGSFLVKNIPTGEVIVLVRIIGYEPFVSEKISLQAGQVVDLGEISLREQAVGLEEVTVVGEKQQIVYKLDRQRINASSSITASGGTAIDILANTPSVQIDAEGGLTFRGSSNFLVYVDES